MTELDPEQDAARRRELGEFLRARRGILQPEDVGLPDRGRRRVSGLRRHEVADLAAVSLTWYTWLEQGRPIRTTPQVLDSLARALRLDAESQRHMFRLAGEQSRPQHTPDGPLDEGLLKFVEDAMPTPAYLITPAADFVVWNPGWTNLFADPLALLPQQRNALWMMLHTPEIRDALENWEDEASGAIARFRAESAKFPGDARFADLVNDLKASSEFFRTAWSEQRVASFIAHLQVVHHPLAGEVRTRLLQLRPLNEPSLTMFIHQPVDEESRQRLEFLARQSQAP